MALISEQVAIPMDLLARFLKISRPDAVRLTEEFASYRWVDVKKFIVADEPWVWLRKSGVEHAGTGFRQVAPKIWHLPHRRAISAVRLKLEEEYPSGRWLCERALWHRKALVHHTPDGIFLVRNKEGRLEEWAIEAELSQKLMKRYQEIAADRCEQYDRLLYFCTPKVAALFRRTPEFNHPRISYEEYFKDPRQIELFQWKWSDASGPGEVAQYGELKAWEVPIVRLISEQGAIPVDQLARFLERDYETAQRIADHLDEAGFISQARGPVDDPPWLWATKMGGRLAGTGLGAWRPNTTAVGALRLQNEARLYVAERDPNARWWSMRLLRRGAEDKRVPMAIVEDDQEQHAVVIESRKCARRELMDRYERLCGQFHAVAVFCSPRRVATFNSLKRECGWDNMFARSFDPLRPPESERARRRKRRPVRFTEIALEDLPAAVLDEVQKEERLATPPQVTLVERYSGRGFPRWRVTTASGQWRVVSTPHGCFARPTSELDERIEVPESVDELPRRKPRSKAPVRDMKKISPKQVPEGALKAIQEEAGLPAPPTALSAKRRRGTGFPRWLVETDAGMWRVTKSPKVGWSAQPADSEKEVSGHYRKTRWPKDPPGVMVDIDPWELPNRVIEEIQHAAGMSWPPKALSAQKRPGPGALRWRVVTDADTWRVTKVGQDWTASLSE